MYLYAKKPKHSYISWRLYQVNKSFESLSTVRPQNEKTFGTQELNESNSNQFKP